MRYTLGDRSLTWLDGQVRNIPASEVPTSHLGIIYFSIVTPSLLEKVHVVKLSIKRFTNTEATLRSTEGRDE